MKLHHKPSSASSSVVRSTFACCAAVPRAVPAHYSPPPRPPTPVVKLKHRSPSPSPCPACLLSVSVVLTPLSTSCEWNRTVFVSLSLAFFVQHKCHPHCGLCCSIFFGLPDFLGGGLGRWTPGCSVPRGQRGACKVPLSLWFMF